MKKSCFVALLLSIIMLTLAGCGGDSVADEKQIQADLPSYYAASDFIGEGEQITSVEIEKRETDKKQKVDVVWCTITTEDGECSYAKDVVLTYDLYDDGGWILDHVSVDDRSEWVIEPLKGISEEAISASLNGINITADDEIWYVYQDNATVSIDEQKTDLDAKTDDVTVTLTIDDSIKEAVGQLEIHYKFDSEWLVESVSGTESFTAKEKPGAALNITDETLLNDLSGQTFRYGSGTTQTITVKKDEITDFEIVKQESSEKGTAVTYLCSATLTKPNAVFSLDIEIPYYYSGEWYLQEPSITAKCTFVSIDGIWTGTNSADSLCELDISVDSDGVITGVYSYDAHSYSGSYDVSGKIDLNTFVIILNAGDWIKEPDTWAEIIKWDITAQLNVDDATISGETGNKFVLSQ